ncbi:MAG: hypothetical protein R3Y10_03045 [Ferrimonas sp.]
MTGAEFGVTSSAAAALSMGLMGGVATSADTALAEDGANINAFDEGDGTELGARSWGAPLRACPMAELDVRSGVAAAE